ncbi:DUF927 domain-containing protein [Lonepinella sp. BR2357]|uniref:DUF927 domain-containing protein n=1 Tax=Lonepinella sp. BR2357 TaxID=3434549 RepID=UPI003F6E29E2
MMNGRLKKAQTGNEKQPQEMEKPKNTPYVDYKEMENQSGLFFINPEQITYKGDTPIIKPEKISWICNKLELKGQGKDNQGDYYYLFSWQNTDEKAPRLEAVALSDFGSETGWKQLKAKGLKMTQGQGLVSKLTDHFHQISQQMPTNWKITKLSGWQNGAYLLPNGEMIGEPTSPIYFTNQSSKSLGYTTGGTLESWQNEIAQNVRGNSSMMLGVAVALSAPMLKILERDSFGVHLFGQSSKGKTTILKIANSIYGKGKDIMLNWNATALSVQNEAAARNDGFVGLDEIGQATDGLMLKKTAYDLFNEISKGQSNKDGVNKEAKHWKITALSTGEKDLETQIKIALGGAKGATVHAGQLVRFLNIQIQDIQALHQFKNTKAHADHLNEKVLEHYGIIGREWISYLAKNKKQVKQKYEEVKLKWIELTETMSDQVKRVATERFATLETALQLAQHLTGWTADENERAITENFLNWKEDYGETNREEKDIAETVINWILQNESRFCTVEPNSGLYDKEFKPQNMAGFKVISTEKEPEHFYIYPNAFREMASDYQIKMACKILFSAGILKPMRKPERNYEYHFTIPKTITGGRKVRAFKIELPQI